MKRLVLAFAVLCAASVAQAQSQRFQIVGSHGELRQGIVYPSGGFSYGTGGFQQWTTWPTYYGYGNGYNNYGYAPYPTYQFYAPVYQQNNYYRPYGYGFGYGW